MKDDKGVTMGQNGPVSQEDEDFERLADRWERDGVDSDLVYLARPLIEGGTGGQQTAAHEILRRVSEHSLEVAEAEYLLTRRMVRDGLKVGRVPHQTEEEFHRAWDGLSGTARGNDLGNMSFGHSDATLRESRRRRTD